MKTIIYYFSGTGNTLFLSKILAEQLSAELIPIAALQNESRIETDADRIGIVFPVYYCDLPVIVREFAEKLTGLEDKSLFAVANYGGAASYSLKRLRSILRSAGGQLSVKIGVHMPQNAFPKPWEKHENLFRRAEKLLRRAAVLIRKQKKATRFSNFVLEYSLYPMFLLMKPLYRKGIMKQSGLTEDHTLTEMVKNIDHLFTVTDDCNACGTCVKICPVNNIELKDGKPVWMHNCENCTACYQYCPKQAIQGGVVRPNYFYRNPHIKLKELIAQQTI